MIEWGGLPLCIAGKEVGQTQSAAASIKDQKDCDGEQWQMPAQLQKCLVGLADQEEIEVAGNQETR